MRPTDEHNDDPLVVITLRKSEAQILKDMIKQQEAYNYLTNSLKSLWVWAVAGGILTVWALYDQIFATGVPK